MMKLAGFSNNFDAPSIFASVICSANNTTPSLSYTAKDNSQNLAPSNTFASGVVYISQSQPF